MDSGMGIWYHVLSLAVADILARIVSDRRSCWSLEDLTHNGGPSSYNIKLHHNIDITTLFPHNHRRNPFRSRSGFR
jgi:hypothetical protein